MDSVDVLNGNVPAAVTVCVAMTVLPSRSVSVPVGATPLVVSVLLRFTGLPASTGAVGPVSVTAVVARLMVCVHVAEVLPV
jgi:hypothetical protein